MKLAVVFAALFGALATTVALAAPPQCERADEQKYELSSAVVEVTVWYHEPNGEGSPGHRGTGVFVTDTTIATVEHVADTIAPGSRVEIGWSETFDEASAVESYAFPISSVTYVETGLHERVALLELRAPIVGRAVAPLGFRPLQDKESVFGIAFRDGALRFAHGVHHLPKRSSEPSEGESKPPPLLFELADWENTVRMVFDFGSSGGPVFNCDGQVVALINQAVTQQLDLSGFAGVLGVLGGMGVTDVPTRISTAWGMYNMTGLPASVIDLEE